MNLSIPKSDHGRYSKLDPISEDADGEEVIDSDVVFNPLLMK